MIIGIGVDLVDIGRFEETLRRTPALAVRLFAESERDRPPRSLAAAISACTACTAIPRLCALACNICGVNPKM